MGMRINTNVPAINTRRTLGRTTLGLTQRLQRLSSGLRINRAADDAAGLAIAERMTSGINQYQQESYNLQSGVSAAQTAEGSLQVQGDAVQRIRELAVQASNGTMTDANREALNAEVQQLLQQIDDAGADTEFNGLSLLNGDAQNVSLGTEGSAELNVEESNSAALNLDSVDISTMQGALDAVNAADAAIEQVASSRASLGAQMNRFESAISQREIQFENTQASRSMIRDADIAQEVMGLTRNQILLQGGTSMLTQANVVPQAALSLLQ